MADPNDPLTFGDFTDLATRVATRVRPSALTQCSVQRKEGEKIAETYNVAVYPIGRLTTEAKDILRFAVDAPVREKHRADVEEQLALHIHRALVAWKKARREADVG